jgi:amino acid transporter
MKKIILIILLAGILNQSNAQDIHRGIIYGKESTAIADNFSIPDHIKYKQKSHLFLIPATVLSCGGAMVFAYSGLFMGGATIRDREQYKQLKDDQRKVMILAATLTVASIPLFVIGRRYLNLYKKELAFNFHMEPVNDYKGQQLQIAAVGLRLGL